MPQATAYGQLARLAEQVCAEFPQVTSVSLLTNEMVYRLEAADFVVNRDSCNKSLVVQLKKLGRLITSEHASERPTPGNTTPEPEPEPAPTAAAEEAFDTEDTSWEVIDGHYSWRNKKGSSFYRAVSDVDEMFYAYSRHGLNLTQVQMLHDFGLSLWEWNTLKVRLLLQKNSNVFSPWTVSITPVEELEAMIEAKVSRRYEKQGPLIERAVHNAAVKQLNKVLAEQNQKDAHTQRLALELSDLLPAVKYRYVARAPKALAGPEHLVFTVADPHVGAQVKKLLNAPRYNTEVLYAYADQLAERINARGAANVYIAGLGDYIESFQGCNHPNSWLQLDADTTRAGAIRAAADFFGYLLERIYNVKEVWGVSGNHDRTSNDKKEDTKGEAAELLFMLLEARYQKTGVQFIYRYDLLVRTIDNICYILGHSHLGMLQNEKKALETIARHREPGRYCVLLSAHLHTRLVKLDADDSRWVFAPSFFTGNNYSSDGGWSSLAGFLTLENGGNNYPRIIDEPLSVQEFTPARLAA